MLAVLSFLLFFPSATFGAFTAEIFPWGILFAAWYLRTISKPMLLMIIFLVISCMYTITTNLINGAILQTDIIRSFAAYMNVILLSQALLVAGKDRAHALVMLSRKIFWFLIALGFIQMIGSDFLGSIIQLIVPRGEGSALSDSNRGVTLLATEPARAGVELALIYLIYRLGRKNEKNHALKDVFLIIFQMLVIKSASAVAFSLGAFLIIYFNPKRGLLTLFLTTAFLLAAGYLIIYFLPAIEGRAAELLKALLSIDLNATALFYVANESGNRLLAIYSFFVSGINHPFGHGVGAWQYSSMVAVMESGLDYRDFRFFDVVGNGSLIPFRGPGVISNLMLDVGIVGLFVIVSLFRTAMLRYQRFNEVSRQALWIFLFKVSLFGSPGNPIVFVFLIVVFLTAGTARSLPTANSEMELDNGKK